MPTRGRFARARVGFAGHNHGVPRVDGPAREDRGGEAEYEKECGRAAHTCDSGLKIAADSADLHNMGLHRAARGVIRW